MNEEQQILKSKYNSGVAQIFRMDALWKNTHKFSLLGKYYLWNSILDRIWCELARDLDENEFDDYEKKFSAFDNELVKTGDIVDEAPKGWKEISTDIKENRKKQYKILTSKDLFLRRLENHLGKGTAWLDQDEDDID